MTIQPLRFITPPTALEAEQALLGAALHNAEAIDRVRGLVEVDDFSEDVHGVIYRTMCERRDAGGLIDGALVRLAIGDHDLGGVTLGEYVARLYAAATTVTGAPDYAKAVRHAAMMRQVLATAQDAVAAMTTGAVTDPTTYASQMIEALDAVATAGRAETNKRVSLAEASALALHAAEEARQGQIERGAPYGIPQLDRMTLGMRRGHFVILAGRPGMGKSTAGVAFALSSAKFGHGTYFVSLEMVAQELAERALAATVYGHGEPIPYRSIADGRELTDNDFERLFEARRRLGKLPFVIEQQPGLTVSQIVARARQLRARWEAKGLRLAVIYIDHLGLVRPSKRYAGNRVQELTEITSALKEAAKELDVALVALCQLSRQVEQRQDKRPILSDLRDSGSIEQDADEVLALYREQYYLERKEDRTDEDNVRLFNAMNVLEVEVLKQRQGPTGRVRLFCDIGSNAIAEMTQ